MYKLPRYLDNYFKKYDIQSIHYFTSKNFKFPDYYKSIIKNKDYNNILIFGCSFAAGTLLDDKQTIDYKLSELTNCNIHNFSAPAFGPQHMLYTIRHNFFGILDNASSLEKNKYAIYIYIPSHLQRIQSRIFPLLHNRGINLQYQLKNNKLELKKYSHNFIYKTFLLKSICQNIDENNRNDFLRYKYNSFMIFNEILLESRNRLQEKFPGIKFVILNYQTEKDENFYELPFMWEALKKEGFIVINTEDLAGRKFKYNTQDTVKDGYHPSEDAWNMIVPELVKKLNLVSE